MELKEYKSSIGEKPLMVVHRSRKSRLLIYILIVLLIVYGIFDFLTDYTRKYLDLPFQLAVPFFIVGFILLLIKEIEGYTHSFVIYRTNISERIGEILNRRVITIDYEDIIKISVEQNLIGRILGYGNLLIDTRSKQGWDIKMKSIPKPFETKQLIEKILSRREYIGKSYSKYREAHPEKRK